MTTVYCFSVLVDAAPAALSRVLDVFTLYSQLPARLVSNRGGPRGLDLVIDVQLDDGWSGSLACCSPPST